MSDRSLGREDYEKRSSLGYAKGLGSSFNGSKVWFKHQIFSFFAIISCLYLFSILCLYTTSYIKLINFMANPINLTLIVLNLLVILKASYFWIKEVITDYVSNHALHLVLMMLLKFILIFMAFASSISLLMIKA